MASTAIERPSALSRFNTSDNLAGTVSSSTSTSVSPSASPSISPSPHSSSTSISSLDASQTKQPKLIDTYGNEFNVPDFTIKDIRDAIPKHCFERSGARGLAYVARDIFLLSTTFVLFNNYIIPSLPNAAARFAAWGVYSFMQGLFATGLWVLAHECGHQAFSPSKTLNDTVGFILHSALLVPYFSWKISHGKHHKATGHLERDMVFVPRTRMQYVKCVGKEVAELMEETPIMTCINLICQQFGGWPTYLMSNVTGHNYHERQSEGRGKGKKNGFLGGVNHFNPSSPLYESKDAKLILLSDIGLAIMGFVLFLASQKWGASNVAVWYGLPYLWVNHWLVAITYLQHTDPSLPHYHPSQWTFARGASATIDREFGFIGRHLLHGIIETHVAHHFISTIPFYHGDEATEAIKKVMGSHYRSDTKGGSLGFVSALWRSAKWCQWVEETEGAEGSGVFFYRNRNGLGIPYAKSGPQLPAAKKSMIVGVDEE